MYHDVINRGDLQEIFDCRGIQVCAIDLLSTAVVNDGFRVVGLIDFRFLQTYWSNKVRVVFLKRRAAPLQKNYNAKEFSCIVCDRSLQDASLYCSIECKVLLVLSHVNFFLGIDVQSKPRRIHCFSWKVLSILKGEEKAKEEEQESSTSGDESGDEDGEAAAGTNSSFRKRPRKVTPRRAPIV